MVLQLVPKLDYISESLGELLSTIGYWALHAKILSHSSLGLENLCLTDSDAEPGFEIILIFLLINLVKPSLFKKIIKSTNPRNNQSPYL